VPGAVLVVGLLLPVGWLQQAWPQSGVGYWMTATILGIVWAYLVRFVSVALQSMQSGYARIPASLDDSARMLGTAARRCSRACTGRCSSARPRRPRCWCSWT
jgi:iron(III) transport system permease protein